MSYQFSIDFGDATRAPKRRVAPAESCRGARKRDPATSHAAAASAGALRAVHQDSILAALDRYGPAGKDRIARLTGLTGVQVCRRLPELVIAELVEPTGRTVESDSGRSEREFRKAARAPTLPAEGLAARGVGDAERSS